MRTIFLLGAIFLYLGSCRVSAESSNWTPSVDHLFISRAIGKTVVFNDPEIPIGVPNCVATALRAGGYLPAFALNGTDSFYEHELPDCFRQIDSKMEPPKIGDLGILYAASVPTLAHAVLFLGEDRIFEKPSPKEQHQFHYNSWQNIVSRVVSSDPTIRYEVWRFNGGRKCIFNQIHASLTQLRNDPTFRTAVEEIEERIESGDWVNPKYLNKMSIQLALKTNEQQMKQQFLSLGRPYHHRTDYNKFRILRFKEDLFNLLLHTPAFQ